MIEDILKSAAEMSLDEEVVRFRNIDISDVKGVDKNNGGFQQLLRSKKKKSYTMMKKAAAISITAGILAFSLSMSMEPVRAFFVQRISTWYDKCIGIHFEEQEVGPITEETMRKPTYLPQGWTMTEDYISNVSVSFFINGPQGEFIVYQQMIGESLWIDNTGCTETEITLGNGETMYLYSYERGDFYLIWNDGYVFSMYAYGVTEDLLFRIAESVE